MSLIVARKYKNNLVIVGDTKLTYPTVDKIAPKDGAIKNIIISPNVAVCYAGGIYNAEKALKEIKDSGDIEYIKTVLLKYHLDSLSTEETEFIIAMGGEPSHFLLFKSGKMSHEENCWIGSVNGFNSFQKFFLGSGETQDRKIHGIEQRLLAMPINGIDGFNDYFSKFFNSFLLVIEDVSVNEVDGFPIPLVFCENKFRYLITCRTVRNFPIEDLEVPEEGWGNIDFKGVPEGSYSEIFSGSESDVLAVHFAIGNIGILYSRKDNGLMVPAVFEMDEIDFQEHLKENTPISLGMVTHHELSRFGEKAFKAFNEKNYDLAFKRCDQAIECAGAHLRAIMNGESESAKVFENLNLDAEAARMWDINKSNLERIVLLKGRTLLALAKFKDADTVFKELLNLNEGLFAGLYFLAEAQNKQGFIEQSFETINQCLAKYGDRYEIFFTRGAFYFNQKMIDLAEQDIERALTLAPEHLDSRNLLNLIKKIKGNF